MRAFVLHRGTSILADTGFSKGIRNAIDILQRDIESICTDIGPNNRIRLFYDPKIPCEQYLLSILPEEITVSYGDELGAVYALLQISERFLGIHPFWFWNDQPIITRRMADVPCGEIHSQPTFVCFRGWFVNDEVLLDAWKENHTDELSIWKLIFETILRLGGNMVIPGTDRRDASLGLLASDMGLWLTQHHGEPLGARMFSRVYPHLTASYPEHPALFEGLWREAAQAYQAQKVVWTVGFRGQGDRAFWENDPAWTTGKKRGELIGHVIRRQMEIVREYSPQAVFCTNLYGEIMELYSQGHLDIPCEVIKIWADNGYGEMVSRRQGNHNPRISSMPLGGSGPQGIYYHVSFYDLQASNHITMSPNSAQMLARSLQGAMDAGANDYLIINCGSVKPHPYTLDLCSMLWTYGHVDAAAHAREYAVRYYGSEAVSSLFSQYAQSTLRYGQNAYDRAGEQYYHFPVRTLAGHMMRGETENASAKLTWAAAGDTLTKQVETLADIYATGLDGWAAFLLACNDAMETLDVHGRQLLKDTLVLQGELHYSGCQGAVNFCRCCLCWLSGEYSKAYLYAGRALQAYQAGTLALSQAEHDTWQGIYRNDCLTNIDLTVRVMRAVRSHIRVCYDGDNQYDWEKQYLTDPSERLVVLLTHRHKQLTDDALCAALEMVIELP